MVSGAHDVGGFDTAPARAFKTLVRVGLLNHSRFTAANLIWRVPWRPYGRLVPVMWCFFTASKKYRHDAVSVSVKLLDTTTRAGYANDARAMMVEFQTIRLGDYLDRRPWWAAPA